MADGMENLNPTQLVEAASAMRDQVADAVQRASERLELERHLEENPWMVLGIAAGAGFVLGGGLWPALRPVVKAVGRAALSPSNVLAVAAALGAMRTAGGQQEQAPGEMDPTPTAH
jgi:hypothetical protein